MRKWVHQILGGAAGKVIRSMSRRRMPRKEGKMDLPGLKAEVTIKLDAQGVPYIYAENRSDLFFAQGFVHAQDRLWQMEINRRVANGRVSEILGKNALETDRLSRTLGFARMAEHDHELISPELREHVKAYCNGINAFLEQEETQLPVEFALLKYKPEPWTELDVLAFTRLMTLQLSNGWGHEIARAHLIEALGPEYATELNLRHHSSTPTTLPFGIEANHRQPDGRLEAFDGPFIKPVGGSNAWVLAGERTDTGKPYLCNDPHLNLLAPSVWYQIYLEGGGVRVQGVSIPGMPLVMIGHNSNISWGITLAFTDIQDVFVEKFETGSESRYHFKDEVLEAEVHRELIDIKGEDESHVEVVVVTRNGPVISEAIDLPLEKKADYHYVLSSPALKPSRLTMGWYGMDIAQGWDDFVEALRFIDAPGLNLVYADTKGNIGHWVTGKTPIRAKGMGEIPRPAWTGEYDWLGAIPFAEMPHVFNPQEGFVVSANHKIVNDDFPHFMGNVWMNGFRASRIRTLLEAQEIWKRDDFGAIHNDLFCIPGMLLADFYRDKTYEDPKLEEARKLLVEWDGFLTAETVGGALYEVVRKEAIRRLVTTASGDETTYDFAIGKGMQPLFFRVNEFQGKDTNALLDMLENPNSSLMQAAGGREVFLENALSDAVAWLKKELGRKPSKWAWGKLHQLQFKHAMAVRKPLDVAFNIGPMEMGGDTDTVLQVSMQPEQGYLANLAAPSYRQIIDLNDFSRSVWVMPPGQSGHPGSNGYDNQVEAWKAGEYFPMMWDADQVEKGTVKRMELKPE